MARGREKGRIERGGRGGEKEVARRGTYVKNLQFHPLLMDTLTKLPPMGDMRAGTL